MEEIERVAAYGLLIDGIPRSDAGVDPAPGSWPVVRVRQSVEAPSVFDRTVVERSVSLPLVTGGRVDLDADQAVAHYRVPAPLDPDDLLHPYFSPAAAWFAHWFGHHSFHAGAIGLGGKAYAVIGAKEAGKSTLLAWLSGAGVPVLADDLVVVADGRAFAGPRCIDLRPPTVEALRDAAPGVSVRGGTRSRVTLDQTDPEWPLGGWIFLRWGERLTLDTVPVRDRMARLSAHRTYRLPPPDPADLVRFAALPAWELARPHGWDLMDAAADLLSETLGS